MNKYDFYRVFIRGTSAGIILGKSLVDWTNGNYFLSLTELILAVCLFNDIDLEMIEKSKELKRNSK